MVEQIVRNHSQNQGTHDARGDADGWLHAAIVQEYWQLFPHGRHLSTTTDQSFHGLRDRQDRKAVG